MHFLSDLEPVSQRQFQKPLDHDDGTIITAYQVAESFADQIRDHFQPRKKTEHFPNNLSEDNNGNILLNIRLKEDHFVTLNYNHRRGRNVEISRIDSIKNHASSYKGKLVGNIVTNLIDQSQKDTLVKLASVFDLSRPILLDNCIYYLKKLHNLFGTNYFGILPSQHPLQTAYLKGLYLTEFGQNTAIKF